MKVLNASMSRLDTTLQEYGGQTASELAYLRSSQDNYTHHLNAKIEALGSNLSQTNKKLTAEVASIKTALNHTLKESFDANLSQINERMTAELANVMSSLNHSLKELLNASFSQNEEQMTAELVNLQASLDSAHSKLDSLTDTTARLSSDHQEIQANISDVECTDTEHSLELNQNMQDNLTHQLENIQDDVTFIREQHRCGEHGWRRVAYVDMTNPHATCPSGWKLTGYSKRTCGRVNNGSRTCSSATFPVNGGEYSRICGRIRGYQWGSPDAFDAYNIRSKVTIDDAYVDGVSVTHGTPRNHIWTFAAGVSEVFFRRITACPCDANITIRIPPYVGEHYFCESGLSQPWTWAASQYTLYSNDTLWDGKDCAATSKCCAQNNPPYFMRNLANSTTDDIEARICLSEGLTNENIAIELVELYVQ